MTSPSPENCPSPDNCPSPGNWADGADAGPGKTSTTQLGPEHRSPRDDGEASNAHDGGEQSTLHDGAEAIDPYGAIRASLAGELPEDFDELVGPTFWPDLALADLETQWTELRQWVEALVTRYPHLITQKAVPACWFRHNELVEALVALRDHERVTFSESSPGTAPAAWHQVFALIEARLREWTAVAGCLSSHREPHVVMRIPSDAEWAAWVEHDKTTRMLRVTPAR